jgi:Uma2 family endonuclease
MPSTTRQRRPNQGEWTVEQYLELDTNRLIEFTDGFLEVLPMPEEVHSFVQRFIFAAVEAFLATRGRGVAHYAPFKVQVRSAAFREPDVCVLLDPGDPRRGRKYWAGADLVIEVVSPGGEARDYLEKRSDYADGQIPEYWIVDPWKKELVLLRLTGGTYSDGEVFRPGQFAESSIAPGFGIDVAACFAAGEQAAANDEPSVGHNG